MSANRRHHKPAEVSLEEVLSQVTELYERDPKAFADGIETGSEQAGYQAGRDYFGLVLGNIAYYQSDLSRESIKRAFDLNDPSFAVGALIGVVRELPKGRFANISD